MDKTTRQFSLRYAMSCTKFVFIEALIIAKKKFNEASEMLQTLRNKLIRIVKVPCSSTYKDKYVDTNKNPQRP